MYKLKEGTDLRILQINSVSGVGSTGRIVENISRLTIHNGHESLIIYGRGQKSINKSSEKIGNRLYTSFHMFLSLFGFNGYGSYISTKKIIKRIIEFNPDIIHLHNLHGYYINFPIIMEFLKGFNKPIFWTLHDAWLYTGNCAYYTYKNCEKWKTQCYSCPQKSEYPYSLFIDRSKFEHQNKINSISSLMNLEFITPSFWLANELKTSKLHKIPVHTISNGIDIECFKENNSIKKFDKFTILGVAKPWTKRKGLNFFIELSGLLKIDEQIILIGLTKKQIKSLPNNIIGIHATNNINELVEYYNAADVFVNPTLEDNFPTTNLESQACGTPVITFDTGGSPESILKTTGIIVYIKSAAELYKAIMTIREKGKESYSSLCRDNALKYNATTKFMEYIELYESKNK